MVHVWSARLDSPGWPAAELAIAGHRPPPVERFAIEPSQLSAPRPHH